MSRPELSVVIPTLNRRETLLETLAALCSQDIEPGMMEIVVVDNGSSDGTLAALSRRDCSGAELSVLTESRPGPAAARNSGLQAARGELVIFIGDDMIPADRGFVAAHRALHAAHPGVAEGVLGRVTWRPDRPVTRFMYWLEHGGPQFRFDELEEGALEPAATLTAANASFKTELLRDLRGFDTRFSFALEEAELGLRMQRAGVTLWYSPSLLVHHDHPQTISAYLRRMEGVGAAARLLFALWPGDAADPARIRRPDRRWPLLQAVRPLLSVAARAPLPARLGPTVWTAATVASYARGYQRAVVPALGELVPGSP